MTLTLKSSPKVKSFETHQLTLLRRMDVIDVHRKKFFFLNCVQWIIDV